MKKIFYSLILMMAVTTLKAQTPTDQDCLGAIAICQDTYYQPNSYSGTGNYPNEIPSGGGCPGNCMLNGEKNDVWYIFTVQTAGLVSFTITPNNQNDDYDWAVYSLNDYKCQDIYSLVQQMQVSCNWSGTPGSTGPNGNGSASCQGAGGSPYNAKIPVLEGETYVINISNYSSTQYGYLLDLTASTAAIYDDVAPLLQEVETENMQCGATNLTISFSEKVLCNTVQATDFGLSGPGGPYTVVGVYGEACEVGGQMENTYTITFTPPIFQSGDYSIFLKFLNFIQDACGNTAGSQSFEFSLSLNSPIAHAGPDVNIPFLGTTTFDASVQGGSGNYSFEWQPADKLVDPTIEDPTTIGLIESTQFTMTAIDDNTTCQSTDQVMVNVVGGEMSIAISANPPSVCAGNQVDLLALPSGGSGTYTYIWSSNPAGFSSDISNPSAFPMVPTTFIVEVNDGYSTKVSEIAVGVLPKPLANAGVDQVINSGTVTTLEGSASEGEPPYSFMWNPAGMINGPADIPNPLTVILYNPQNYSLIVTDGNGCPSDPSAVLINASGAGLSAFPQADPPEICVGGSTILQANATGGGGNYTYIWTNNITPEWSATGDFITVSPTANTVYFVEVKDAFTSFTTHIIVQVNALPEINLLPSGYPQTGIDTIVACVRDTIILDAGNLSNPPDMLYLWSNSWANRYMVAQTNGNWWDIITYTVDVKNQITGCSSSDQITVIFDFNQCAIGVSENTAQICPVSVLPNPNTGSFSVQSSENINQLTLQFMTIQGAAIIEETYFDVKAGDNKIKIDINHLPNGVYLLRILADERVYTQKIIKN